MSTYWHQPWTLPPAQLYARTEAHGTGERHPEKVAGGAPMSLQASLLPRD